MIRVAATRIFADPSQSIMELPVNSIDSYRRLRSRRKGLPPPPSVGKFGMGFFSILYWLIGHPQTQLIIESMYQDGIWKLKIQEIDGILQAQFLDPEETISGRISRYIDGTSIYLVTDQPKLSLLFKPQLERLQFIPDIQIKYNETMITSNGSSDIVRIGSISKIIDISDDAEGISLPFLFTSFSIHCRAIL